MAKNPTIHQSAHVGFGNASAYDAHRPSYPAEAVQKLLDKLAVAGKPHSKIVDLAAGTGKFTELLAAREEQYEVVAVEPHESMRNTLVAKALKGVDVRTGTATEMDIEDGWADAVVVAQAFHWFAHEQALEEIRRVLKPEGKLVVIWNVDDYNKPKAWKASTQWEQKLHELVLDAAHDGQPRFRDYVWKDVFDRQTGLFESVSQEQTSWTIRLGHEALWERLHTISHIAMLEGAAKENFRAEFDKIVKSEDADWSENGEVAAHGVTAFWWTTRL